MLHTVGYAIKWLRPTQLCSHAFLGVPPAGLLGTLPLNCFLAAGHLGNEDVLHARHDWCEKQSTRHKLLFYGIFFKQILLTPLLVESCFLKNSNQLIPGMSSLFPHVVDFLWN